MKKQYLTFLLPHFTSLIKPVQMITQVMTPTKANTSLMVLLVSSSTILIRWRLGTKVADVVLVVRADVLGVDGAVVGGVSAAQFSQ